VRRDFVSRGRVASPAAQPKRSIVLKTFVRQQYAGRHTSARIALLHFTNKVQKKRTQTRAPPPFYSSRFQGEASFATSWVLKLGPQDSWPPHPFQASLLVVPSSDLRSPTVWCCCCSYLSSLPLGEPLTSLSFHLTVAHFLCLPVSINLVLIPPSSSTNRRPPLLHSTTLRPVHVAPTLVQLSNHHIPTK
jgi:hypothetical protein